MFSQIFSFDVRGRSIGLLTHWTLI